MITNRFQLMEKTKDGKKAVLHGMVFKFYDGALKAAGNLVRIHPDISYIIQDKQTKAEYMLNQCNA